MTIRLTVHGALWRSHVARVVNQVDGLVPVVKGNGYGFGRTWLAEAASEFSDTVAVGTVHELAGLPATVRPVVLTPTLSAPESTDPVLTVGSDEHIDRLAAAGWMGQVLVKLASPMRRFGGSATLIPAARAAGLDVIGVSIHPPIAGTDAEHRQAIVAQLPEIDTALPVWVSHLDLDTYAELPASHEYRLRLGTALWHGDKSFLHLTADVLDVHPVRAGATVGYRQHSIEIDGHLVMIGAGSASGISELADGRSPFHFRRQRLPLVEAPHMHTSMAFVPHGETCPLVGDEVDVQRPLITTTVDDYVWH